MAVVGIFVFPHDWPLDLDYPDWRHNWKNTISSHLVFFYIFLFYGTYSSLSNAPSNHHTECALRKLCLIGTLVFINHWQLSVFTYGMVWGTHTILIARIASWYTWSAARCTPNEWRAAKWCGSLRHRRESCKSLLAILSNRLRHASDHQMFWQESLEVQFLWIFSKITVFP